MYCFGGNHRYSLIGRFGGNIGGNPWGNLGGNLGCKLWTEKNLNKKHFFWDSNPGQIDDFHLMGLFSLSIYIRNITYLRTVIQRLKKKTQGPLCSPKRNVCCFGEGKPLNLLNFTQVSAILSGTQSGNQIGEPACVFSRSCYPV